MKIKTLLLTGVAAVALAGCDLFGAGGYLNITAMPSKFYDSTVDIISEEARMYAQDEENAEELLEQIDAFDELFEESEGEDPTKVLSLFFPVKDFYVQELNSDDSLSAVVSVDTITGEPRTERSIKLSSVELFSDNITMYMLGGVQ